MRAYEKKYEFLALNENVKPKPTSALKASTERGIYFGRPKVLRFAKTIPHTGVSR